MASGRVAFIACLSASAVWQLRQRRAGSVPARCHLVTTVPFGLAAALDAADLVAPLAALLGAAVGGLATYLVEDKRQSHIREMDREVIEGWSLLLLAQSGSATQSPRRLRRFSRTRHPNREGEHHVAPGKDPDHLCIHRRP